MILDMKFEEEKKQLKEKVNETNGSNRTKGLEAAFIYKM